jgi:peptide/nickel transport system substrate-binding protein
MSTRETVPAATTKRRIRVGAIALGLAASFAVVGCGGVAKTNDSASSSSGTSGGKPVLTIGLSYGPTSLDPAKNNDQLSSIVSSMTNTPLFHEGSGFNVAPDLATSSKYVGKGNTVYEFTIRSGAKFSDGTPLNAQAVKAWLEYFVKANGPFASGLPIKTIQTPGPDTVRLVLSSPDPIMPLELSEFDNAGFVSNVQHSATLATTSDGVGPYVIDPSQTQVGSQFTLVPNKNYYDQSAIHYSKVVFKIISSNTSMLEALQAGQLDAANVDPAVVKGLTNSEFTIHHTPGGVAIIDFIDRNGSAFKELGNLDVRQALNYAINRQAIVKALDPEGSASDQIATDFSDPSLNNYYSYDPAKAKALLAAAGYQHGFTINMIDGGSLYGNEGDPTAQAVAQDWSAIGVKTQITSPASTSQLIEQSLSKKFALSELGFTNLPTLYVYAEILSPKSALNPFHADNPAVDAAVGAGAVAQGSAEAAAFQKVNDLITQEAAFAPVFTYFNDWAVSSHISGVDDSALEPWPSEWSSNG